MSCCCEDPSASGTECCTLAATLAVGNTTGGSDVVMSTGDILTSESSLQALAAAVSGVTAGNPASWAAGDAVDGDGGDASVSGGDAHYVGGDVNLTAGGATGASGSAGGVYKGGDVNIDAGSSPVTGGDVNIEAGARSITFVTGDRAGAVNIAGGLNNNEGGGVLNGGDVNIQGGNSAEGDRGDVNISGTNIALNGNVSAGGPVDFPELVPPTNYRTDVRWQVLSNSGQFQSLGSGPGTVGTQTATMLADTNAYTRTTITECLESVASSGNYTRIRDSNRGLFGYALDAWFMWGIALGTGNASNQCFAGLIEGNPTTTNPSSFTNMMGFGWDSGDANISFYSRGAGFLEKRDTGIAVPASDRSDVYIGRIRRFGVDEVSLIRMSDGFEFSYSGVIALANPATGVVYQPYMLTNTGGVSAVTGIGIAGFGGVRSIS